MLSLPCSRCVLNLLTWIFFFTICCCFLFSLFYSNIFLTITTMRVFSFFLLSNDLILSLFMCFKLLLDAISVLIDKRKNTENICCVFFWVKEFFSMHTYATLFRYIAVSHDIRRCVRAAQKRVCAQAHLHRVRALLGK